MFYVLWTLVSFLILIPLYLLPSILAIRKNHFYKIPIILINILCGWFGLGWVAALVWCFIEPASRPVVIDKSAIGGFSTDVTNEIERLYELKEKGVLTQGEFDQRKKKLLES